VNTFSFFGFFVNVSSTPRDSMNLVILLIAILAVIIYSVTKKNTTSSKNKIEAQQKLIDSNDFEKKIIEQKYKEKEIQLV
jgi:competence protein ComGC